MCEVFWCQILIGIYVKLFEIGEVVFFFVFDWVSFVIGQIIQVDGGIVVYQVMFVEIG